MNKPFLYLLLTLICVGCNFDYSPSQPQGQSLALMLSGNPTSVNVNEGSSVVIIPALTTTSAEDIQIDVTITSPRNDVASFFTQTFPLTVTIPAGQTSVPLTIYTSADPTFTGDLPFGLSVTSPQLSSSVLLNLNLVDQQTLILGSFTIDGIEDGDGVMDTTPDTTLHNSVIPKLSWATSTNATSYDVSILEDDGATVKCAVVNTTTTSLAFPVTCQLTEGNYYRAKVVARASIVSEPAPLLRFEVTSNITLAGDTAMIMYNGSAITFDPRGNDANPTAIITGVDTPSAGSTSFTASSITYTPNNSATGLITFLYTVNDNGTTSMGRVRVKLMTAHTWTGSINHDFATSGNWCGSVTTPGVSGSCSGGATPDNSQKAIIDLTCSENCSPAIASASSISVGGIQLGGNSLSVGSGATLETGRYGFIQTAGTFSGGSASININGEYNGSSYEGDFTLNGGTFHSTSGTLKLKRVNVSIGAAAIFNHNSGTVQFGSNWNFTQSITTNGKTFHHVSFYSDGDDIQATLSDTLNVNGDLYLKDSAWTGSSLTGGHVNLKGNLITEGFGLEGNTVIELLGNAAGQTVSGVSGSGIPGLKINTVDKAVTFSGDFSIRAGSYEMASVGTFSATGNTIRFNSGGCSELNLIPGNVNYNNLRLETGCQGYNLGAGTMKLLGDLIFENTDYETVINNGTITVAKNIDTSNSQGSKGTGVIKLIGNAAGQTVTGGTTSLIPNLVLETGSNPVTFTSRVGVWSNFKINSVGTFTPPSNLVLDGGCNGYGTGVFTPVLGTHVYHDITLRGGCPSFDLGGHTINVSGDLTFGADNSDDHGSLTNGTFNVAGDFTINTEDGLDGDAKIILTGNPSGQTIYANHTNAMIPDLEIDAGPYAVSIAGTGRLVIEGDYTYITSGAFTQTIPMNLGSNFGCPTAKTYQMGSVTYSDIVIETDCNRDVYFTTSVNIANDLTILHSGRVNMPNPGTGHSLTVGGTYNNPDGAQVILNGATFTH